MNIPAYQLALSFACCILFIEDVEGTVPCHASMKLEMVRVRLSNELSAAAVRCTPRVCGTARAGMYMAVRIEVLSGTSVHQGD